MRSISTKCAGLFFSLFALTMLFSNCSKQESIAPQQQPAAIEANQLKLTSSIGNGVNVQPSYYNNGNVDFGFTLMKTYTKIKTLRIEIEPDKVSQAVTWIKNARTNGYAVIATYHKSAVLGSDSQSDLTDAANWWKTNYKTLTSNGAYTFTVNLMNEWGSHNMTANNFASYYNSAISIVRTVYSGPIIIDASGWGQETAILAAAVKGTNGTKITDTNIILSIHVYPGAYNQAKGRWLNTSDLDDLASAGRPCIVGEFGNEGSGSADWAGIVTYARATKGWTVLGWVWNGDGQSTTYDMVTPRWVNNATATSFSTSSYFSTIYNQL